MPNETELPPDPGPEPALKTYPIVQALELIAAIESLLLSVSGGSTRGADATADASRGWRGKGRQGFVDGADDADRYLQHAKRDLDADIRTLKAEIKAAQAAQTEFNLSHAHWRNQKAARDGALAAGGS